jgi:hypothetical protein
MTEQQVIHAPFAAEWRQTLVHRLWSMTLLWLVLGILVGMGVGPGHNAIGLVCGAIAGVIVLTWLGPILGLLGGRVRESLAGSLCGCLVTVTTGAFAGQSTLFYAASLGLILGGLMGANFAIMLFLFKQVRQQLVGLTR